MKSSLNKVLYLSRDGESFSHFGKMAGIVRYCSSRGWVAESVIRQGFSAEILSGILRRHRPIGCIVDGVATHVNLPPRLFGGIPVTYIGYRREEVGNLPNFIFDANAIAKMAFRELAAGMPECYAVVGQPHSMPWSRLRTRAFRDVVRAAGAECLVFQPMTRPTAEMIDSFDERLAAWIAGLPEHCAVFAVSDVVAIHVERAARAALRDIPRSLTLVSVDNIEELCETADPPISSIQLDFERMGFLAATALGDEIAGGTRFRTANADAWTRILPIFVEPFLIVRRKSTSGGGRHEKFILDAVETIRRKAADGLTATELMARYPVSKSLFNLRFREATGHSVHDEILHVRLEKAFTLLAQTDTAIGAIPGLCGFNCDRTLDAIFRKRFGMSMRDWRKKNGCDRFFGQN